ncbi:hypothetical protein [Deinococcus aluminii]|uniref:Uncharacterized protein n=1 Tax=Deinococcus aluminii TaxID=1656885 RepID=A0ABP9XC79_9DEIO
MSRLAVTLPLLVCACWSLAGAAPPRPSDLPPLPRGGTPVGVNPNVGAVQSAVPTLELLLTVRLLTELTTRGTLTFGPDAAEVLRAELRTLATAPTLGPLTAEQVQTRLLAALTGPQRALLTRARADLDRRAELLAARARFAAPDGPVNPTLTRYGFQVPGGLGVVLRLTQHPEDNPYLDSAPNRAALQRLLTTLAR